MLTFTITDSSVQHPPLARRLAEKVVDQGFCGYMVDVVHFTGEQ